MGGCQPAEAMANSTSFRFVYYCSGNLTPTLQQLQSYTPTVIVIPLIVQPVDHQHLQIASSSPLLIIIITLNLCPLGLLYLDWYHFGRPSICLLNKQFSRSVDGLRICILSVPRQSRNNFLCPSFSSQKDKRPSE